TGVVGRNHQGVARILRKVFGNLAHTFFRIRNFTDASLGPQGSNPLRNISASKEFNDLLKLGVSLSHDLVEICCAHPSLLQLFERTAGLNCLMLADISNK